MIVGCLMALVLSTPGNMPVQRIPVAVEASGSVSGRGGAAEDQKPSLRLRWDLQMPSQQAA